VLFIPSLCFLNFVLSCWNLCHYNVLVSVWNVNYDAPCSLPWLFSFCFLYVGCSCFKCDNSVPCMALSSWTFLFCFSQWLFLKSVLLSWIVSCLMWLVCLSLFWPFCSCLLWVGYQCPCLPCMNMSVYLDCHMQCLLFDRIHTFITALLIESYSCWCGLVHLFHCANVFHDIASSYLLPLSEWLSAYAACIFESVRWPLLLHCAYVSCKFLSCSHFE